MMDIMSFHSCEGFEANLIIEGAFIEGGGANSRHYDVSKSALGHHLPF